MATAATPSIWTTMLLFFLIRLTTPSTSLNGPAEYAAWIEEEDGVVLCGCHPDEILHLAVRDVNDLVSAVQVFLCHVTHGLKLSSTHLQVCYGVLAGMDKNQVVNGRNQLPFWSFRGFNHLVAHRKKIIDPKAVKATLDLQFSMVGNTHREPMQLFGERHNDYLLENNRRGTSHKIVRLPLSS